MTKEPDPKQDEPRPEARPLKDGAAKGLHVVGDQLAAAVGIVRKRRKLPGENASDTGTKLAVERTELALERSYLANERTLMAWIRTSLSMISFGFTIGKLGQAMKSVEVKKLLGDSMMSISVHSLAYMLVVVGTAVLIVASIQFRARTNRLMRNGLPTRFSMAFYIALLIALIGGGAFSALVLGL